MLNLGTGWRTVVIFMLQPLYSRRCPWNRKLAEHRTQSGHFGEEANLLRGVSVFI